MLPKLTIVAALVALLAGPASAQPGSIGLTPPADPPPTQADINQKKAEERAYQSAISRIPGQVQKSDDPWGGVRPTPPTPAKKNKQQ